MRDYVGRMPELDLEPRKHSSFYELKPMNRWWLLVPISLIALGAYLNGLTNVNTWALVFFGALLMALLVLVFPKYFLSRRD